MQHDDKRAVLREVLRNVDVRAQRSGVGSEMSKRGEAITCFWVHGHASILLRVVSSGIRERGLPRLDVDQFCKDQFLAGLQKTRGSRYVIRPMNARNVRTVRCARQGPLVGRLDADDALDHPEGAARVSLSDLHIRTKDQACCADLILVGRGERFSFHALRTNSSCFAKG